MRSQITGRLSRTEIEHALRTLLQKYHAQAALLFGSYARGDETAGSDIDVLVIGGDGFKKTDIFAFAEELREMTGKAVDAFELCEVTPGTPFYETVMNEGVRIAY
ncbi:MAG: nucleotidyltransferase domain-containing protein [Clostridia bacterium]|nr:nucleotidyltransferase domain-containing protein [Clostridia bacterium]